MGGVTGHGAQLSATKMAPLAATSGTVMYIFLIALVPATGLLLPQQKLTRPVRAHSRLACVMSAKESGDAQTLTITLTGCSDGIGVGLNDDNCVDLLRPGLPAAKALQLGDKIMQWNGNKMVDEDGERRMLKDVVVSADSHELLVERPPSLALLAGEWESGLTCLEYADEKQGELRLGVYVAYSMDEAEPHIRPLCASTSDDGVSALLCDEGVPSAPISSARRVLDPDVVFVSERQAGGGQGLGNPHGEHGEECFDLREALISAGVHVVVREGRDTERVL